MKKTLLLLFAFLLSASTAYSATVAFVDVNIVPMDKERVLEQPKG